MPFLSSCVFCRCCRALRATDNDGQLLEHIFRHTQLDNPRALLSTRQWMLEDRPVAVGMA